MSQIGFMITSSPHGGTGSRSFYLLAAAALEKGHGVHAFFCQDGVYQCLGTQVPSPGSNFSSSDYLTALVKRGAHITVSSQCMKLRGIPAKVLCEGVRVGSYEALGKVLDEVDKVVCL